MNFEFVRSFFFFCLSNQACNLNLTHTRKIGWVERNLSCSDQQHKHTSFNPFHTTGLFRYPLKTSENQRFPDIFRGYRKRPVTWNGLKVFSKLQVLRILGKSIFCLTISWRRPSSYRNQSIDLLANQWTGFCMITTPVMKELSLCELENTQTSVNLV